MLISIVQIQRLTEILRNQQHLSNQMKITAKGFASFCLILAIGLVTLCFCQYMIYSMIKAHLVFRVEKNHLFVPSSYYDHEYEPDNYFQVPEPYFKEAYKSAYTGGPFWQDEFDLSASN